MATELKPEDVKKAMECCKDRECASCVRYDNDIREEDNCRLDLIHQALALLRENDEDYRTLEILYQEKCDQVLKANELLVEKNAEIADLRESYKIQCEATDRLLKSNAEKDAEIERLNALNKVLKDNNSQCHRLGYEDAITEFAERLKANNPKTVGCDVFYPFVYFETIDQIAKEMKGN